MSKKLYVGSLPYETTEDDLRNHFAECGTIESATVIIDKITGRSKGFGFVEFATDEEAATAMERLNGSSLGRRTIVVNEAKPPMQRDRGPRQGGGGGRFRRDSY